MKKINSITNRYRVRSSVPVALWYSKPLNALAIYIDKDDSSKQGLIDRIGRTQETILIAFSIQDFK